MKQRIELASQTYTEGGFEKQEYQADKTDGTGYLAVSIYNNQVNKDCGCRNHPDYPLS